MAASLDLGTLRVQVAVQNDDRGWAAAKQSGVDLEKATRVNMQKVGENISKVGSGLTKWLTLPMAAAATACVKYASDMTETSGKIGVVFAENTDAVMKWSEASINQMGLAQQTALDMAASYGDLGSAMGITNDKNMEMSTSLVQLAADMASFKNISVDRAAVALNGIYTGETESLKAMGVVMTEANLEQYAMNQGIEKNIKDMSQQELVMLRYNYVLDQTTNAQGDFARTGDSTANQMRKAKETLKQLATTLGQQLIPVVNRVLTALNNMLSGLLNMDEGTKKLVITIGAMVAAIGPALQMTGKIITAVDTIRDKIENLDRVTTKSAGIIGAVTLAVTVLVGVVSSAVSQYRELTEDAIELNEATQKSVDNINAAEKAYEDNTTAAYASAEMAKQYVDRLSDLEEQSSLTRGEQAEYKVIVERLAELYPQLNLEIDEQTGLLKNGADAIRDQISAMKQKAIYEAAEERYKAVIKESTDLLYAQKKAQVELEMKTDESNKAKQRQAQIEREYKKLTGESIIALKTLSDDAIRQRYKESDAARALLVEYRDLNITIDHNAVSIGALNQALDSNAAAQKNAEQNVAVADETLQRLGATLDSAATSADGASGAVDDLGASMEASEPKTVDYTDTIINEFDRFDKAVKITLAKATENLQKNNEDTQVWMGNLQTLIDKGVDEGVVQKLYEMGPAYRGVVQQLVDANDTDMQKFVDAMGLSGKLGGERFSSNVSTGIQSGQSAVNSDAKETVKGAISAGEEASKDAQYVGVNIGAGIGNGISSQSEIIASIIRSAVRRAIAAAREEADMHSPSRKMRDLVGKPLAQGVTVGWDDEIQNTLRTVKSGIGNLISGAMPPIGHIPGSKATGTATAARTAPVISPTINFTAREMTPYEEMVRVRNLSKALAQGVR